MRRAEEGVFRGGAEARGRRGSREGREEEENREGREDDSWRCALEEFYGREAAQTASAAKLVVIRFAGANYNLFAPFASFAPFA